VQVYVTELYESRFAICFNFLFNAEIQLLCAVGLSNPGKVHAKSSRSGNMPLTRRHALPCCVGLGTIQSKLYISHPLPHSSQIHRKKNCSVVQWSSESAWFFVLQKWGPTKKHGYLSSPQKFLPVWLPQAWSVYYSPPRQPKTGSPALRTELTQWMVPSRSESYELQTAITAIYLPSSTERVM